MFLYFKPFFVSLAHCAIHTNCYFFLVSSWYCLILSAVTALQEVYFWQFLLSKRLWFWFSCNLPVNVFFLPLRKNVVKTSYLSWNITKKIKHTCLKLPLPSKTLKTQFLGRKTQKDILGAKPPELGVSMPFWVISSVCHHFLQCSSPFLLLRKVVRDLYSFFSSWGKVIVT